MHFRRASGGAVPAGDLPAGAPSLCRPRAGPCPAPGEVAGRQPADRQAAAHQSPLPQRQPAADARARHRHQGAAGCQPSSACRDGSRACGARMLGTLSSAHCGLSRRVAMLAVRLLIAVLLALAAVPCPLPAVAQQADRCLAVAQSPGLVVPTDYRPADLKPTEVRLTFVGHSTWLIETPGAVKIATDYNDYLRPPVVPDIATMNRAHTSHYSNFPDPNIRHVLRGWNPEGGPVRYDMTVSDVRVRNVPTNIRDWGGGTIPYGNSIFIFEVAGLCIGHLGHLHHTLTDQQLGQIGQLDVV